MNKAAELGSRSWAHELALSVWGFIQLFAVCPPKLSRFSARCWDALAEMPPAGLKTSVFAAGTWEAENRGEEEYGAVQEEGKNRTPDPERAQPTPALDVACGSIMVQPQGFWELKITPNTRERLRMLFLSACRSYPN